MFTACEGSEIFRLMESQWSVMETLTPQGFLAFGTLVQHLVSILSDRVEIILGLTKSMRGTNFDPLEQFRKIAERDPNRHALNRLTEACKSHRSSMQSCLGFVGLQ